MSETKKALGRKSRRLKLENRAKVFLTIAKKPSSFSELLTETKLSRASLTQHLKFLEREGAIYRDVIKPNETSNPKEVGKIIYKVKIDEVPEIINETLMVGLETILAVFRENKELYRKLEFHIREINKAICEYLNYLNKTREQALKTELERLRKLKR